MASKSMTVSLVFVLLIYFDCVMYFYATISIFKTKMVAAPEKAGVILHPYLAIMVTSLQQLLSSVPKVAILERFTITNSKKNIYTE